jgi:hypothetical protein
MARKLVWIENRNFEGFGRSNCQWVFKTTGPFVGRSLDKMKEAYEAERDKSSLPTSAQSTQDPPTQKPNSRRVFFLNGPKLSVTRIPDN